MIQLRRTIERMSDTIYTNLRMYVCWMFWRRVVVWLVWVVSPLVDKCRKILTEKESFQTKQENKEKKALLRTR